MQRYSFQVVALLALALTLAVAPTRTHAQSNDTLKIAIRGGRDFGDLDHARSRRVMLVNGTTADGAGSGRRDGWTTAADSEVMPAAGRAPGTTSTPGTIRLCSAAASGCVWR